RHQARVDEGEGLAHELGGDRSRLDQLVDRKAATDAHHDAGDVLRPHWQVRGPEVARPRLERAGDGAPKLGLALGVAGAELGIAECEAPVLALEQHRVALLAELPSELPACLHRHVAFGGRRFEQRDPLAHRCVDALLEQRQEEVFLVGEVPVDRTLRVARLGGDLVDAGLLVAPTGEDSERRRQELVATLASLRAGGAGAPIETRRALSWLPAFYVNSHWVNISTDRSVCMRST